jgi:hypothetical protein
MSSIKFFNNLTVNNKGATSFKSTNNSVLDLFTYQNTKVPLELDNFRQLFTMIETSFVSNPELTFKLMKYKRLIKKGEGMRMVTYIMMLLVKNQDRNLYSELLGWYRESNKDLLRLARMAKYFNGDNNVELTMFVDNLMNSLVGVLNGDKNIDLLPFKYLPSNNSHFDSERTVIRNILNDKLMTKYKLIDLVALMATTGERGKRVIEFFVNTYSAHQTFVTNKTLRQLKSYFDGIQYLGTPLLKGYHFDGTPFGCSVNPETEYKMIADYLSKLSTQALERVKKTIYKYKNTEGKTLSQRESYLVAGLEQYQKLMSEKPEKVKTNGLVLTEQLWEVFQEPSKFTASLEAQVKKQSEELREYLATSFDDSYTFEQFVSELQLVIDMSGSMDGKPFQTALYHALLLWEAFGLREVVFFETDAHLVGLPKNLSIQDKIKYLYRNTMGSTQLDRALEYVQENYNLTRQRKFVLVLTDGDCDYCFSSNGSNNPFHKYYETLPEHRFCVFNLKQEKLCFPYLMDDPRTSYLGGNNMKVLIGVTKALVTAIKNNTNFTPNDVLMAALDLEELNFDFMKYNFSYHTSKLLSEQKMMKMFNVVKHNVPKVKATEPNIPEEIKTLVTSGRHYTLVQQLMNGTQWKAVDVADISSDDSSDDDTTGSKILNEQLPQIEEDIEVESIESDN